MKKIFLFILTAAIFSFACRKNDFVRPAHETVTCTPQTADPAGRTYAADSVVAFICTQKHCGILPLNRNNYWIYQDSIFSDGVFSKVQYDTLRYLVNKKTLTDGLVWWEANKSVGLPDILYANDSAFFGLSDRLFNPDLVDVKKEFGIFRGDSLRYLTSFEDAAAQGRSLRYDSPFLTPAGSFNDYYYFDKNARNYRRDQVYFKPGIGVLKYIFEKSPIGARVIKLQLVSTLVSFHIE